MIPARPLTVVAVGAAAVLALVGCSSSADSANAAKVAVSYDDTTCTASPGTVPAGTVEISATYTGSSTAEVYLYAKDGDAFTKVVGEAEDLTNGLTKSFGASVAAGSYEIACKSGGKDVRTALTVS